MSNLSSGITIEDEYIEFVAYKEEYHYEVPFGYAHTVEPKTF